MAGFSTGVGARLGFTMAPQYAPPATASEAAFGPGVTPTYNGTPSLPSGPHRLAFLLGTGAIGLLVLVRFSLPN